MATRYTIQMDFDKAKRHANELDDIAERLERTSGAKLADTLNKLGNDWKGENASLYIKKGFVLKEDIVKTAQSLRKTAATIRSVAKKIYDTEMENLRIAEERSSRSAKVSKSGGGSAFGGGGGGGRGW